MILFTVIFINFAAKIFGYFSFDTWFSGLSLEVF